jgi:hypothetical protein
VIAPRCAGSPCRRRLKRGAAKLAPLRYTQTDAAPYPLQPSPSRRAQRDLNGNGNGNGNGNCNGNGNGNGNGNCRYAYVNRNRFRRVHYPKGIAPGSQTGTALSADFSSPPSVECP